MLRDVLIVCGLVSLAGCGGGGSSGGASGPVVAPAPNYATMASESRALIQRYGNVAPTGILPTAGVASYSGYARYSTVDANTAANNPELMSRMRMTADFGTKAVSGSFDTFVDAANNPVNGSATITSATIVQDSFVGAVSSAINVPGGGSAFNGTVIGTFYGPQANAAIGLMDTAIAGKPAIAIFGAEQ